MGKTAARAPIDKFWAFIDLEKSYRKVDRQMLKSVLRKYGMSEYLRTMGNDLYRSPKIVI